MTKLLKINNLPKQDLSWSLMKLSFLFVWVSIMFIMIGDCSGCPFPVGLCKLYSFSFLFTPSGKIILKIIISVAALLYLLEIKMAATTLLLFFLSCIITTVHESNGIFFRATIMSIIWGAQSLAYIRYYLEPTFNIQYWRVQYVMQMVAAVYTLAGISKLWASGIGWVETGPLFSLQIIKNYASNYSDTGAMAVLDHGKSIAYGLIRHKYILELMLTISLFLELFCFAALLNSRIKIIYGIALLMMHIGIAVFMGIGISVIAFPMVIYFLNPLYFFVVVTRRIYHRILVS